MGMLCVVLVMAKISFCLLSSYKMRFGLNLNEKYIFIKFYYDCVCVTFEFMSRFGFVLFFATTRFVKSVFIRELTGDQLLKFWKLKFKLLLFGSSLKTHQQSLKYIIWVKIDLEICQIQIWIKIDLECLSDTKFR